MPKLLVRVPQLRAFRGRALLTQQELADKAGIHRVTLATLETGGVATPATVRKLAAALDATPADLMSLYCPDCTHDWEAHHASDGRCEGLVTLEKRHGDDAIMERCHCRNKPPSGEQ